MRTQLLAGLLMVGTLVAGSLMYATTPSSHHQHVSASGALTGRVLDAEGQPVAEAKVYADRNDAPMGRRPYVLTDKQGGFLLENLTPGIYTISASKEEDGYPPTDSIFYSAGFVDAPQVSIYEQQTTSDVVIYLGQKLAKLAGKVIDVATGKPIRDAQVTLCRQDSPDNCLKLSPNLPEMGGGFESLVPSTPFTVEVSAPGYAKKHMGSLRLKQKEIKRMDIPLQSDK